MPHGGINVPAQAGGASGGAWQQKPPIKEWYTLIVYERPRVKKAVLYLGRWQTFKFKLPAAVKIGDIAVIIKWWRVGGTVAYSTSIHVANLAKLLSNYAREEAETAGILEPILREAEERLAKVMAHADGAQPEAVQLTTPREVCSKVADLIHDMRSDGYLAVRIDEFVGSVNAALQVTAEERGQEAAPVTAEDVRRCLRLDDTVRVVGDRGGGEALWLWGGWYVFMLADRAAKAALRYGAVLMEAEKYGEEGGGGV